MEKQRKTKTVDNRWNETRDYQACCSYDLMVELNPDGGAIPVPDYEENVSNKVVKIIQSYTGVVNKMVWRKPL